MTDKISIRIGVRVPLLQNAGVFVVKVTEEDFQMMTIAFGTIVGILEMNGASEIAKRFVLEKR